MQETGTTPNGYRKLSEDEINLINEIKEHGGTTLALLNKIQNLREGQWEELHRTEDETVGNGLTAEMLVESASCTNSASSSLKEGQMWLVRSVALPSGF
jgi:hypothetical protein